MIRWLTSKVELWRLSRELDRKLAARKALRSQRSQAALKGWETRKGRAA